ASLGGGNASARGAGAEERDRARVRGEERVHAREYVERSHLRHQRFARLGEHGIAAPPVTVVERRAVERREEIGEARPLGRSGHARETRETRLTLRASPPASRERFW